MGQSCKAPRSQTSVNVSNKDPKKDKLALKTQTVSVKEEVELDTRIIVRVVGTIRGQRSKQGLNNANVPRINTLTIKRRNCYNV